MCYFLSFVKTVQNIRLEPVTAPGILSLVLNIMCASLNLIRGVHLIEYSFQVRAIVRLSQISKVQRASVSLLKHQTCYGS